ncbi:hypothetical protein RPATATE_0520 [Rickettsia parkeri str. Tate's Hell]|uniref:Uncharacterized protein n=1 Tax=Rickettsia parkeri str. Tate's Hell TaxID=1359189 RepID=A0ABR5DRZ3_RICPA|nr:hypothetical protein RPAAT24_0404 [Rickettsia parkeri str. AT\
MQEGIYADETISCNLREIATSLRSSQGIVAGTGKALGVKPRDDRGEIDPHNNASSQ